MAFGKQTCIARHEHPVATPLRSPSFSGFQSLLYLCDVLSSAEVLPSSCRQAESAYVN